MRSPRNLALLLLSLLLTLGNGPSFAGHNAGATIHLSWSRDTLLTNLAPGNASHAVFYIIISNAPDISAFSFSTCISPATGSTAFHVVPDTSACSNCSYLSTLSSPAIFLGDSIWLAVHAQSQQTLSPLAITLAADSTTAAPSTIMVKDIRLVDSYGAVDAPAVVQCLTTDGGSGAPPLPTITGVFPQRLVSDTADTLTVGALNIPHNATTAIVTAGTVTQALSTVQLDSTRLRAVFQLPRGVEGPSSVILSGDGGYADTMSASALTILPPYDHHTLLVAFSHPVVPDTASRNATLQPHAITSRGVSQCLQHLSTVSITNLLPDRHVGSDRLTTELEPSEPRVTCLDYLYAVTLEDTAVVAARDSFLADTSDVMIATLNQISQTNGLPNDTYFPLQWQLFNQGPFGLSSANDTRALASWDQPYGASTGTVHVGVIDSGIDGTHPDLQSRVLPGVDLVGGGNSLVDISYDGHGTACAGLIDAVGNNGAGIIGICNNNPHISVVSLKAGDVHGNITDAAAVQAINWATNNGVGVLSISWGNDKRNDLIQAACREALFNGVSIMASTGNFDYGYLQYPAGFSPSVVAVGASFMDGARWTDTTIPWTTFGSTGPFGSNGVVEGSSYGSPVRFLAPGGRFVTSTYPVAGGSYEVADPYHQITGFGGTSAAAPIAAGAAAQLLSRRSDLTGDDVGWILAKTARKLSAADFDLQTGYGDIDLNAALAAADPNRVLWRSGPAGCIDTGPTDWHTITVPHWPALRTGVNQVQGQRHIMHGTITIPSSYNLQAPFIAWPTSGYCWGAISDDNANIDSWQPESRVISVSGNQVTLETYVYYCVDATGGFVGWWPSDPSGARVGCSILGYGHATDVAQNPNATSYCRVLSNPAHGGIDCEFVAPNATPVRVSIFDLVGRRVGFLEGSGRGLSPQVLRWDSAGGEHISSGVYYVRTSIGGNVQSHKVVVLR